MRRLGLFSHAFVAMGSPCEIQLYACNQAQADQVFKNAVADIWRLESRYSRYRRESLLSTINSVAASGGRIEVDEETACLLNYAETCYRQSDGLFDITSGILRRAWHFPRGQPPDRSEIDALLEAVGWHRLIWKSPVLEFPVPGMELDLGGVVKEYAADRVAGLCRDAGLHHGLVNLGGDIHVIGPRIDGSPWRIGIQHPRQKGALIQTLTLHRGGLASSGDYERCIILNGVRYSHILNPKTGWPVRYLASVSVVADFCVVAGSASTIAMLKEQAGPPWLEELGLPHYWVDERGDVGGSLCA